jgi:hypothetical protein
MQDAERAFQARVCALNYNGSPFGDHDTAMRRDDGAGITFTKNFQEALALAHVIVRLDLPVRRIENREPPFPDMLVTMLDGSEIFVEVAQLLNPAHAEYHGNLEKLDEAIRLRLLNDHGLTARFEDRFLEFLLPQAPRGRSRIDECVSEIVEFAMRPDLDSLPQDDLVQVDPRYRALTELGAKFHFARGCSKLGVQSDARSIDRGAVAAQIPVLLDKKRAKSYAGSPIWLLLYMAEVLHDPRHTIAMAGSMNLGQIRPFERLIVGDARMQIVFGADGRIARD